MSGREELDPLAPQREAAIFYGLFLRGHSADDLRRDIDVPRPLVSKWLQPQRYKRISEIPFGVCIPIARRY